jgi:hypothetical protein
MQNNQHILNVILFFAVTICIVIGSIFYSSVLVFYFLGFIGTIILIKAGNKGNKQFVDTLTIFLANLFFGLLLALMVNLDFVQNGKTFRYPDQIDFFEQAIYLASNNSVSEVILAASVNYLEYNVAYGLFGVLGYFDRQLTGSVNFLPLLFSVVYITALIPVFLYHTLKLYVPRLALKGSLYYGLLTPIMAYSGYLLRDMHMALLFMIILFWMVRKVTILRVLGILAILPIIANLRLANSLLVLALLAIFIFSGKTSRFIRIASIIVGVGMLIYFTNEIVQIVTATQERLEMYEEFTREQVEDSDGLGKQINRLPPVIKETATIFIGLTSFPFWGKPPANIDLPQFTMVLYSTLTNIGWFFIIIGVFYFIKPIYIKVRKIPTKMLLYLILLFALYMVMNVNNMNLRRIIYVFPFVYIPFLMVYQDLTHKQKKTYKQVTFSFGLFLTITYMILLMR